MQKPLGPIETSISGANHTVLHAKTTSGVLDPQSHVIPVQKSLFCIQKPHMKAGTHRDIQLWS